MRDQITPNPDAHKPQTEGATAELEDADKKPPIVDVSASNERAKEIRDGVVSVARTVFDPEIPVNIYELGLIYDVHVSENLDCEVIFTLTSPNCPAAQSIPAEIERKIKGLDGVQDVRMTLTWEPPWSPDKMTEAAKLQLNMF
jgi:FeS assembly SUF system protein